MHKLFLPLLAISLTACIEHSDEPKVPRFAYQCESGRMVHASYPADKPAIVGYEGQVYKMDVAVSASGARYVEYERKEVEWWTKGSGVGSTATLSYLKDGKAQVIETCVELETKE